MWQLISTWHRQDRRVEWVAPTSPTPPIADRIVAAIGPVAERHRMGPPRPAEHSVTWCTSYDELRTIGQDEAYGDHEPLCTDLVVDVDPDRRTISAELEPHGLAEFVTERSHRDGPIDVPLADDFDESLTIVADHLDRMCGSVIVRDR